MSTTRQITAEELRARITVWETVRLPRLRAMYSPNYNHFCDIVDDLRQELAEVEAGRPIFYRGFTAADVFSREPGSEAIQDLLLVIGTGLRNGQRLTTGVPLGTAKPVRIKPALSMTNTL